MIRPGISACTDREIVSPAMLTPESRDLLRSVYDDLLQPDPYPETASIDDQDAWIRREEAESALAGLISTALAPGRVDKPTLNETRVLVERGGTRADPARVAVALRVLARATESRGVL